MACEEGKKEDASSAHTQKHTHKEREGMHRVLQNKTQKMSGNGRFSIGCGRHTSASAKAPSHRRGVRGEGGSPGGGAPLLEEAHHVMVALAAGVVQGGVAVLPHTHTQGGQHGET